MKSKIVSLLLSTALAVSIITGCGNTGAEPSTDNLATQEQTADAGAESTEASTDASAEAQTEDAAAKEPSTYDELIESLHAGQSYAYAPILEGDNALLVTSYTFELDGQQEACEATIFIEKDGSIEKVTTVQSGGSAYPIAVTEDNSLILCMRNSVAKGYVSKENGKFVITEESNISYSEAEDGFYHNYKEDGSEVPEDASLFDELSDLYTKSKVLGFEKAGADADGAPKLSGAVYAAYEGDDLYNVAGYFVFDSETTGTTQTPDGVSGVPFSYELNGEDITFHFGSADDTSEAKFGWDIPSYPTLTFSGDNASGFDKITLSCLGNEDPKAFDAARYYDNDNNLYMQVKSFDETSLTGDLYRNERIKKEYVDDAAENSTIYSINGTAFTVVSFEDVNKELAYGTDEEFKKDVLGSTRFDKFLVKCSDDDFYYALQKEEYEDSYNVVAMLTEGNLRKLIEENVTFSIKENCEIILLKYVENGDGGNIKEEYVIGREFKGDNYPGWSQDAKEYYLTTDMLVAVGVVDRELYNFVQVYVP